MSLAKSAAMEGLVFSDGQESNPRNKQISAALAREGGGFIGQFFMSCRAGPYYAVGLAGQKKKRDRAVRITAAVCMALASPDARSELEKDCGQLASLVRQVERLP